MKKIGRNEPCPCGSGKKFKNCHLGREEELWVIETEIMSQEVAQSITNLPEVNYGRSKEFGEALKIEELTGNSRFQGIKFIDFDHYVDMEPFDKKSLNTMNRQGGALIVNPKKTEKADDKNIYMAITPEINDSSLAHELAHVLDFLGGSGLLPGSAFQISLGTQIPMEHLDHLGEYGDWLDFLADTFQVELNAEDRIISYLNEHDMLIPASLLKNKDIDGLINQSNKMMVFLVKHKPEINELIKDRLGYQDGIASA
jgi:hypothetical protein